MESQNFQKLETYYTKNFPLEKVLQLFSLSGTGRREDFNEAMMLVFIDGEQTLVDRTQPLSTLKHNLRRKQLVSIHAGACYLYGFDAAHQRFLHPSSLSPVFRRMVLDFDLPDNRTCCQGICKTCWDEILIPVLTTTWNLLVKNGIEFSSFFSGGRGFHVYIHQPTFLWFATPQNRRAFVRKLSSVVLKDHPSLFFTPDQLAAEAEEPCIFDEQVTTDLSHMLRLPYSVHNKTGCIVFPITPSTAFFQVKKNTLFSPKSTAAAAKKVKLETQTQVK